MSNKDKYHKITEQYLKALDKAKDERMIHSFLKSRPYLIRNAFNPLAWNHISIISEFQLTNKYRIDFLILSADSGQWFVTFIELKSHRSHPFTKEGLYSRTLNQGIQQLQNRMIWIQQNDILFRQLLSEYFRKKRVPSKCSMANIHTQAMTEIMDTRTFISFHYYLVIGRRDMINQDLQAKRHLFGIDKIEIVTFDRLLDVAIKLDNPNININV